MSEIWNRIVAHEGEIFHTKTNLELIYEVDGDVLRHNRTHVVLHKSDFEKALELHPKCPADIQGKVTGSSYVFAILNDPRIKSKL